MKCFPIKATRPGNKYPRCRQRQKRRGAGCRLSLIHIFVCYAEFAFPEVRIDFFFLTEGQYAYGDTANLDVYKRQAYGQVVVESTEQVFYFSGFGNGEIVAELLSVLQHIVEPVSYTHL